MVPDSDKRAATKRLLAWLDDPSSRRGIHFYQDDEQWSFHSYAAISRDARAAAATIQAARARRGGIVAIVLPTGPDFVAAFFGALLAGDTPCPVAPPGPLQEPHEYRERVAGILAVATPSLVITTPQLAPWVGSTLSSATLCGTPVVTSLDAAGDEVERGPASNLALLQFTSGSSGSPRGARVTPSNLVANIEIMRRWVDLSSEDSIVSWLPLFHDMGLIGCLLLPAVASIGTRIMQPEQFVRSPQQWLDCFGRGDATIGASPSFGFGYARRRVAADQLVGSDFSRWRVAAVAAERIDPGVLSDFVALLSPYGFRAESVLPAYGLAEATLAVAGGQPHRRASVTRIDWSDLGLGRRVVVRDKAKVGDRGAIEAGDGWLVSCGLLGPGLSLRIIGESGEQLHEGTLGEIEIDGPTIADGYQGSDDARSSKFTSRGLSTGDAGFILDDELYVVGRIGDSVKVRGRSVYMEDVESKLACISGISQGRCVAVSGSTENGDCLVAVVEADEGPWAQAAAALLERTAGQALEVRLMRGPRGAIQRTSSGKPRRRVMWQALIAGDLAADLVYRRAARAAREPSARPRSVDDRRGLSLHAVGGHSGTPTGEALKQ